MGIDPRWLIYLPPTMAPTATTRAEGLLEHPNEAFDAYRSLTVSTVICEEKHMGSRAIVVVCRNQAAAARRSLTIGQPTASFTPELDAHFRGPVLTRPSILERVRTAVTAAGLWDEARDRLARARLRTPAVVGQAEDLLPRQYAASERQRPRHWRANVRPRCHCARSRASTVTELLSANEDRITMVAVSSMAYRRSLLVSRDLG